MTKEHSESSMTPTVSADVIERMARAYRDALIAPGAWDGMVAHSPSLAEAHRAAMTAALEAGGLIEALALFARAADELDDDTPIDLRAEDSMSIETALFEASQPTVGDLRRAASIFTQATETSNG